MYHITVKPKQELYQSVTVVDYNLIFKFLIIGAVEYPAYARLQKVENQSTMVIQNNCKQAFHTCSFVCTM